MCFKVDGLNVNISAKVNILKNIQLNIEPGDKIAVIGESGSGKTTLLKALVRHLSHEFNVSGEIYFEDERIDLLSKKQLNLIKSKKIAYIPQNSGGMLTPSMSIKSQLLEAVYCAFPSLSKQTATKLCVDILRKLDFDDPISILNAYPNSLSGGMEQRIVIAMALLRKPKLILADEPTSALDYQNKKSVMELLTCSSCQLLFISHDIELAISHANKILIMYAGSIVEEGSAQDITFRPLHPYTKDLFASKISGNLSKKQPLKIISGQPLQSNLKGSFCSYVNRCADAMQICTHKVPPTYQLKNRRKVSCFKYDERCNDPTNF